MLRKKLYHALVAAVILLLLAVTLAERLRGTEPAGNPAATVSPVQLVWAHHFGEEGSRKWLEIGTESFRKLNPGVTFKMLPIDGGDYVPFLRTKAVSGEMPDLYMIDNIDAAQDLIDAGYAYDLTGQPFLEQVDSAYLKGAQTKDGRIWALPIDVNGVGVTYNKSVFARAGIRQVPVTWTEFLQACQALEAAGYTPIASGFKETWTLAWDLNADLIASVLQQDPLYIQKVELGLATFSGSEPFRQVVERLGQRYAYMNRNPFGASWDEALDLLGSGRAGMIINGTWSVDGVRSKYPDADIGLFAFPASEDPVQSRFALKSTGGIVVNPRSPHKELALKVLARFAEPEMGTVLQQDKKSISVLKGLPADFDPAFAELDRMYRKPGRIIDWSSIDTGFKNQELGNLFITGLTDYLLDPAHNATRALKRMDDGFNQLRARIMEGEGGTP